MDAETNEAISEVYRTMRAEAAQLRGEIDKAVQKVAEHGRRNREQQGKELQEQLDRIAGNIHGNGQPGLKTQIALLEQRMTQYEGALKEHNGLLVEIRDSLRPQVKSASEPPKGKREWITKPMLEKLAFLLVTVATLYLSRYLDPQLPQPPQQQPQQPVASQK